MSSTCSELMSTPYTPSGERGGRAGRNGNGTDRGRQSRVHVPVVGLVLAFTGHYWSVQVLAAFLRRMGVRLVTSHITTPSMIEIGTTLGSADFCLPLRAYIGHVHRLIEEHPELDAIVAPNVLSEDGRSATCSKYRDLGGVVIRSLGHSLGYLLNQLEGAGRNLAAGERLGSWGRRLACLVGEQAVRSWWERAARVPRLIMPDVRRLDWVEMRNVCYNVYADLMGWARACDAAFFLPRRWRPWVRVGQALARVEEAFRDAYAEVIGSGCAAEELPELPPLLDLLSPADRPRLALVGRRYLVNDPLLSGDIKRWFSRRGVKVLTAADLPAEVLAKGRAEAEGFYDTYKEAQAFVRWALDKVDGFVCIGSFGCHPDAFQVDYLAEQIRAHGVPCWTFRFDEGMAGAGFETRFETILNFLEKRRDARLGGDGSAGRATKLAEGRAGTSPDAGTGTCQSVPAGSAGSAAGSGKVATAVAAAAESTPGSIPRPRKPLIIWPYMGEIINLLVEELGHQLGLSEYMLAPLPLDEESMLLGNDRYTESCSPYACSTGSLKQTLQRALSMLKDDPRRILMLMARGEGPCTFGWYAIVQSRHLPHEFREQLEAGGHTLEMATMGLSGVVDFLHDLCELGNAKSLKPIVDFVGLSRWSSDGSSYGSGRGWGQGSGRGLGQGSSEGPGQGSGRRNPGRWQRFVLRLRFYLALLRLARPVWAKLRAAESLRARALIIRAHEVRAGATAAAYEQALELLRQAHTPREIRRAHRRGLELLGGVEQDGQVRPRVVAAGEIYVALTSYANRGTVEVLLGREHIEVVEGTTLRGFLVHSLKEMARRRLRASPPVRVVLEWLRRHNVTVARLEQQEREPRAKPFLVHEVGGDGMPTVGHVRRAVEEGCDGIVHLHPLKCMPEGIAEDAIKEVAQVYDVAYLGLSFDKETDVERLRTELATFAALLHGRLARYRRHRRQEIMRRRRLGRVVDAMYRTWRRCYRLG
ncbi:MAG TPA: hypothetical protein GXX55_09610 [Firmicutes bacterium]|nr:hypothetical protein [Bacillota bacterium]